MINLCCALAGWQSEVFKQDVVLFIEFSAQRSIDAAFAFRTDHGWRAQVEEQKRYASNQ